MMERAVDVIDLSLSLWCLPPHPNPIILSSAWEPSPVFDVLHLCNLISVIPCSSLRPYNNRKPRHSLLSNLCLRVCALLLLHLSDKTAFVLATSRTCPNFLSQIAVK